MGCDIHLYVEFCEDPNTENPYWYSLGKVRPGRSYIMFEAMAGVRGDLPSIVPTRGLPPKIGFDVDYDYYLMVNDKYSNQENYCSTENADRWVANGSSTNKFRDEYRWISGPDWHTPSWLTTQEFSDAIDLAEMRLVDWFEREQPKTAKWLETMKVISEQAGTKEATENYFKYEALYKQPEKVSVTYKAILAMMKMLPNARVVFWFDN